MNLDFFHHIPDHVKHHFLDILIVGVGWSASIVSIMQVINPVLTGGVLILTIVLTVMRIIALIEERKKK